MPPELERDLGLFATTTISVGAMIGSGIFVLPGLAAAKAGPAVVLAYFLAGVVVLPAALSKAEMATALPEAGGTYLYIDRAMGPVLGTRAGLGAWFSLVFKSAFALVGLGAYLLVLVDVPAGLLTVVGLTIAGLLLVVNVAGVKQSGRLQSAIVSLVVLSLFAFVADGGTYVERSSFHPFFSHGTGGLLAATGFVFVSYAGVTKIASVAEEVEDPGRNIPSAILGSVVSMMLLYTLTAFVVVGVTPPVELHDDLTPMATAASQFAGEAARLGVAAVAVLALTSMANAGVLASSRYPFAMSRDSLAPTRLSAVSDRFQTPVAAISVTGVLLLSLIAFVPVGDLAKLASAFQILVFGLVNVALVVFRESTLDWYDPAFVAPGYPWVQLFGLAGSLVLLTTMGIVPLAGAAGIVVVGAVWYRLYGRERTTREGAALDTIRRRVGDQTVTRTERAVSDAGGNVLVVVADDASPERIEALVAVGGAVAAENGGDLHVVQLTSVPEQTMLSAVSFPERATETFEAVVEASVTAPAVDVSIDELPSHNPKRTVVNVADDVGASVVFGARDPTYLHPSLVGGDVEWFMNHAPCDVGFLQMHGDDDVGAVTVLVEPGLFDSAKVAVGTAIAAHNDATLRFVSAIPSDASEGVVTATADFFEQLADVSPVRTEWDVVETDDRVSTLVEETADADLVVLGFAAHSTLYTLLFGDVSTELGDRIEGNVLLYHSTASETGSVLRKAVERLTFGTRDRRTVEGD